MVESTFAERRKLAHPIKLGAIVRLGEIPLLHRSLYFEEVVQRVFFPRFNLFVGKLGRFSIEVMRLCKELNVVVRKDSVSQSPAIAKRLIVVRIDRILL